MIVPPFLKKGDKIGIVATARKMTVADCATAISILKKWGLVPVLGRTISPVSFNSSLGAKNNSFKNAINVAESHQFAGTDDFRAADFQAMLDNPDIKAILCARGGYGTVRMVDKLNFMGFKKDPKWIIGYSDITVLHSHIVQNLAVQTLHATMPINFKKNTPEALESLRKGLFGEPLSYSFAPHFLNKKGTAKGILVGGNLSVLYSLLGSASDVDTEGKVLFLEDLDEYLYHIDRMMVNLKRAGKLANLAGLLVGGMSDMNDNTIPFGKTVLEIIAEHTADYTYPVAYGFPAGHFDDNRALVMGQEMSLEVGEDGVVFF